MSWDESDLLVLLAEHEERQHDPTNGGHWADLRALQKATPADVDGLYEAAEILRDDGLAEWTGTPEADPRSFGRIRLTPKGRRNAQDLARDRLRVVWVLGSGFSKPLGGPLLGELLSERSAQDLVSRYPEDKYPKLYDAQARIVRPLYNTGKAQSLWDDAEACLEHLEDVAQSEPEDPQRKRLTALLRKLDSDGIIRLEGSAEDAAPICTHAARRLIAAECSGFLLGQKTKTERWQPYLDWATKVVKTGDSIVTFNYDLVVEKVAIAADNSRWISVRAPEENDFPPDLVPLLKLHGSVNWKRIEAVQGVRFSVNEREEFVLTCVDEQMAIASPGQGKRRTAKELKELWQLAAEAVTRADALVFVGYRFPDSDVDALRHFQRAIGLNDRPNLSVHVVLGSDQEGQRLESLIASSLRKRTATSRYRVVRGPMRTQEFLLTQSRDDLFHEALTK